VKPAEFYLKTQYQHFRLLKTIPHKIAVRLLYSYTELFYPKKHTFPDFETFKIGLTFFVQFFQNLYLHNRLLCDKVNKDFL